MTERENGTERENDRKKKKKKTGQQAKKMK